MAYDSMLDPVFLPLGGGPAFLQLQQPARRQAPQPQQLHSAPGQNQAADGQPPAGTAASPAKKRKQKDQHPAPARVLNAAAPNDDGAATSAPLQPALLFDLNGTLTSHTSQRNSSGVTKLRPGLQHLHRLQVGSPPHAPGPAAPGRDQLSVLCSQERFRLGIFSSASAMTVGKAVKMIQEAAPAPDGGLQLFSRRPLIFTRTHTQAVQQAHIDAGGKEWDTVKPLHLRKQATGPLDKVLLVDDDEFKVGLGQAALLWVPVWKARLTSRHRPGSAGPAGKPGAHPQVGRQRSGRQRRRAARQRAPRAGALGSRRGRPAVLSSGDRAGAPALARTSCRQPRAAMYAEHRGLAQVTAASGKRLVQEPAANGDEAEFAELYATPAGETQAVSAVAMAAA